MKIRQVKKYLRRNYTIDMNNMFFMDEKIELKIQPFIDKMDNKLRKKMFGIFWEKAKKAIDFLKQKELLESK